MAGDGGDDAFQLVTGDVLRDGLAVPGELIAGHLVHAVSGGEAAGGELDVARADNRAYRGLVWRLVGAEPDVAVRPEDLRLAELLAEFLGQIGHRAEHGLVVDRLVSGPVGLGILLLEAVVEVERRLWPPLECHAPHPSRLRVGSRISSQPSEKLDRRTPVGYPVAADRRKARRTAATKPAPANSAVISATPWRNVVTGSPIETLASTATRPATPRTVPTCLPMLRMPLPVPNLAAGTAAAPTPSREGMDRPTPAPPMS